MSFLRLTVFGFLVLAVVYLLVSVYSRSVRREKLENRWDEEFGAGTDEIARNDYIKEGMKKYEKGLRKKLIGLVFVVPVLVVVLLVYLTNYY